MWTYFLGLSLILVATNVIAGPQAAAKGAKASFHPKSEVGQNAMTSFISDLGKTRTTHKYELEGGNKMGLMKSSRDGTSGTIDTFNVSPDGSVWSTHFSLPVSERIPMKETISYSADGQSAGVYREYSSMQRQFDSTASASPKKVTQNFRVKELRAQADPSQKAIRVPTEFKISEGNWEGSMLNQNGDIIVNRTTLGSNGTDKINWSTKLDGKTIDGDVVGWNLYNEGTEMQLLVLKNGEVKETTYQLRPAKGVADGVRGLEAVPATFRPLTQAEIKRLALAADKKVIPGRTTVKAPVRGLQVEAAPSSSK